MFWRRGGCCFVIYIYKNLAFTPHQRRTQCLLKKQLQLNYLNLQRKALILKLQQEIKKLTRNGVNLRPKIASIARVYKTHCIRNKVTIDTEMDRYDNWFECDEQPRVTWPRTILIPSVTHVPLNHRPHQCHVRFVFTLKTPKRSLHFGLT